MYRERSPALELDKGCRLSAAPVGRFSVSPWPRCRSLLCLLYSGIAMAKRIPRGRSVVWVLHSMPSFRLYRLSSEVAFQSRWCKVLASCAGHGTRIQDLCETFATTILQVEDLWEVFGYLSDYGSCIWSRSTIRKALPDLKQTSREPGGSYHCRRHGA